MSTIELFDEMKTLWDVFESEHNKFNEKGNKAAGVRARKSIGDLKKLVTEYRKTSILESKK